MSTKLAEARRHRLSTKLAELDAIDTAKLYPLPVFRRLSGLSDWAMRQARRNGLKVKQVGNRRYVAGSDWAAYLAQLES